MPPDFRQALRQLVKSPGYVGVAILIVAIGIGAATAMFSTVNALVLRPIALPEPERLALVYETNLSRNIPQFSVSVPNFLDWKKRNTSWESLAAIGWDAMNLTDGPEPELAYVRELTADFLPTLGIPLALGRNFTAEEDRPGPNRVALISTGYWQRRYAGKPDVLGQTLTLDGIPYTIVGVVARSSLFQPWENIMVPMASDLAREDRLDHNIHVYGRLKPGVTLEQADAEMKLVAGQIWNELPELERGWSTQLVPLAEELVDRGVRTTLYLLLGAVGLLLLIACANLSNLMLVRASARAHELAVRTALGASRGDLVRQLLCEGLLVTFAGGLAGVVLAMWAVDFLHGLPLPRAHEISIDFRVLGVAFAASLATGLLASGGPAFRASHTRPQAALKGRAPLSGHRSRLRDTMVVAQLALSLTLLVGVALLARSFVRLMQVDPGFASENVLTLTARTPADHPVAFYDEMARRISALPGVSSAGLITQLPLSGPGPSLNVFPLGPALIPNEESIQANWRLIHGDYFATMRIPLLQGHGFERLPPAQAASSIVVSRRLARTLFGDSDPIGRQLKLGSGAQPLTIIGLVGDVRSERLALEPAPAYYLSIHRFTWGPMSLVVRSPGELSPLVAALRKTIKEIDPGASLFQIRTMNDLRAESLEQERLLIALLGTFAGVALLLAALGTYGVVSFTVHQRTPEIGLRLAVGAQRHHILRLVLGQGFRLAALGLVLGLAGAFAASRVLAALLYETPATDTASYALAAVALAATALLASVVPAHRATRVDPLTALRAE